jgi:membrane-anchored mycosin MYCP
VKVRHVVVVASVANDAGAGVTGQDTMSYPAAYPGVLAVTAVSSDGTVDSSAPRGSWVSIAAPGTALMTVTRGGRGYVSVNGTSFATAVVAGTAALLRQRFPRMSPEQIIERLEQTAVPPGAGRHDPAMGYGIVDPYAALTTAAAPSGQPSAPTRAAVPVQKLHRAARHGNSATVLGVTTLLVALAVLVGLATMSVRAGRRRGWYPGTEPRTELDARTAEPHPAELA